MTQEIITQISSTVGTEVFGIWFLDRSCICILYAGRIRYGRDRIHQSKECR